MWTVLDAKAMAMNVATEWRSSDGGNTGPCEDPKAANRGRSNAFANNLAGCNESSFVLQGLFQRGHEPKAHKRTCSSMAPTEENIIKICL